MLVVSPSNLQIRTQKNFHQPQSTPFLSAFKLPVISKIDSYHIGDDKQLEESPRITLTESAQKKLSKAIATLNLKAGLGFGLAYASSIAIGYTALASLLPSGGFASNACLIGIGLNLISRVVLMNRVGPALAKSHASLPYEERRVEQSIARVSSEGKVPTPAIRFIEAKKVPGAGIWDRLVHQDVLVLNPSLISALSERQLDGVIAHELSHSNRFFSKLDSINAYLKMIAGLASFWGGAALGYSFLQPSVSIGNFGTTVFAACVGVVTMLTHNAINSFFQSYASRANELKTDLRAIRLTKDPAGLISAIKYFVDAMGKKRSKILTPFYSHPPLAKREESLKRVFG